MYHRRRAGAAAIAIALALAGPAGPVLAAPPSNDDIGSPMVATQVPYTNEQSTVEATTGATDVNCFDDVHTVWYQLTASETVRLEANTFGSDFDTTLAVGTPDGSGGIDLIACDDDTQDLQSRVRWDAVADTTYLFQVGSCCGSDGGNLVFNIDVAPPFVPVEFTLTLNNRGSVDQGVATISGTYSCEGATEVVVEVFARQRVGRFFVTSDAFGVFECTSSSTWELQLFPNGGTFAGGKLQVSLFAGACNDETCEFVEIQRTIGLRR